MPLHTSVAPLPLPAVFMLLGLAILDDQRRIIEPSESALYLDEWYNKTMVGKPGSRQGQTLDLSWKSMSYAAPSKPPAHFCKRFVWGGGVTDEKNSWSPPKPPPAPALPPKPPAARTESAASTKRESSQAVPVEGSAAAGDQRVQADSGVVRVAHHMNASNELKNHQGGGVSVRGWDWSRLFSFSKSSTKPSGQSHLEPCLSHVPKT